VCGLLPPLPTVREWVCNAIAVILGSLPNLDGVTDIATIATRTTILQEDFMTNRTTETTATMVLDMVDMVITIATGKVVASDQ